MTQKIFCLLAILIVYSAPAISSTGTRGGGDEIALEFHMALQNALQVIEARSPKLQSLIEGADLGEFAKTVRVFVSPEPLTLLVEQVEPGSPIDCSIREERYILSRMRKLDPVAINDRAKNEIVIDRARWKAVTDSRIREGLALHEFASLKGLECSGVYEISLQYVGLFGLPPMAVIDPLLVSHLNYRYIVDGLFQTIDSNDPDRVIQYLMDYRLGAQVFNGRGETPLGYTLRTQKREMFEALMRFYSAKALRNERVLSR